MAEHEHVSCQEVVELVTDYLDQALAARRGVAVRAARQLLRRLRLVPRPDAHDGRHRRADHGGGRAARHAREAARRLPGVEALVNAYKFLRADGTGVFTRFAWPLPDGGPGRVGGGEPGSRAAAASTPAGSATCPTGRAGCSTRSSSTATSSSTRRRWSPPRGRLLRRIDALGRRLPRRLHAPLRRPRARDRARDRPRALGGGHRALDPRGPGAARLRRRPDRRGGRRRRGLPRRAGAPEPPGSPAGSGSCNA